MPLLWQPKAHSSPVPSKACQTSNASCGNSPSIGKQEHPVTVGVVRLDLTQHHLCKGSCSGVGPSPNFTQHVDIIHIPEKIPQVLALVDFDATSSFVDQTFVAQHNIHVVKKSTLVPVEVIDGRTIAFGVFTHETTPLELHIGKHTEKIVPNIISTPHHPVILGLPWLEAHNPIIDWRSRTFTFSTQRCTFQEPQAQENTLSSPTKNHVVKNPKRVGTNSSLVKSVLSSPIVKSPPMARTKPCPIKNLVENLAQKTNPVRIFFDGAVPFYQAAKNLQVFAIHVNPGNNKNPQSEPKPVKLPEKYTDFADVFEKIRLISSLNIVHTTAQLI